MPAFGLRQFPFSMSRSALGKGLGSLLAENAGQGIPMPGPGVGRLLKGEPRVEPPSPEVSLLRVERSEVDVPPASVPAWNPARDIRWCLGVADFALVFVAIWLGALSPAAGSPIGIAAAAILLAVGSFLGVLALLRR